MRFSLLLFLGMVSSFSFSQIILSESFNGTMDPGTDLPTNWNEAGLSTDGIWSTADAATASSQWVTYPVPPDGSIFAYSNDDACNCDKSNDVMILPTLDLTNNSYVQMNLDYLVYNANLDSLKLLASTDGGATWTIVHAFAATGAVWSDNFQIDLNNYANTANVTFAFYYNDNGLWSYGVGIDDLSILDPSRFAVLDFVGEYSMIPSTQVTPMELTAQVTNTSLANYSDVVLTTNVYLNGALDQTFSSAATTFNSGDTLLINSGTYTPGVQGDYTFEYITSSATAPTFYADTLQYNFSVTDGPYARDLSVPFGFPLGFSGTIGGRVVSRFEIVQDDFVHAAYTKLNIVAQNVGDSIQFEIYESTNGVPGALIGNSAVYIAGTADVGHLDLTLPVADTAGNIIPLAVGHYFVAVREFGSNYGFSYLYSNGITRDSTTFYSEDTSSLWVPYTQTQFPNYVPIMRPILSNCMLTSTITATSPTCNGDSDATAQLVVSGSSTTPSSWNVQWDAAAGNQTTLNIGSLAAGTYTVMVMDSLMCGVQDTVVIVDPPVLNVTSTDNGDGTATANVSGGVPPYQYLWDASTGGQTAATTIVLPNGNYSVSVTDSNGCTTTSNVTISSNTVGVDDLSMSNNLVLYPNPTSGDAFLKLSDVSDQFIEVNIIDPAGKIVYTREVSYSSGQVIKLPVNDLAKGVYTIRALLSEGVANQRLIIE